MPPTFVGETWFGALRTTGRAARGPTPCKTQQTTPLTHFRGHISIVTMLMWPRGRPAGRFGDYYIEREARSRTLGAHRGLLYAATRAVGGYAGAEPRLRNANTRSASIRMYTGPLSRNSSQSSP